MTSIKVKALVNKEKNRIMFIESEGDFVDVLLGFLTMPMGILIERIHRHRLTVRICTNNLYKSVQGLDKKYFRTPECKSMLLHPQSGTEAQLNSLKVKMYEHHQDWYICSGVSGICDHKLLSRYNGASCACGALMNCALIPNEIVSKDKAHDEDTGAFVKVSSQYLITDDLQIIPLTKTSTFSLLSRLGVTNASATEERTFAVGYREMAKLLKCSLESETALTETFLELGTEPKLIKKHLIHGTRHESEEGKSGNETVDIRLIVSKSKKVVCYADAGEGFVDLLFSFLTVPLGHVFKEIRGAPLKGCSFNLYKSVADLDAAKYFKSDEHKNMLLCPKVAPLFGFEKQLLKVDEALNKKYYCYFNPKGEAKLITFKPSTFSYELTVMDPKSCFKKATKGGGGFVTTPATFTVTDDLVIAPVSPLFCLSILNKMQVPPEDVEEHVVQVGVKEASELLVASVTSDTALTDVFLRRNQTMMV